MRGKFIMFSKVRVWEEEVIIPTYAIGEPDKNPMFLEKRVYQGSSGKVYPHPVIDKIYDTKTDKKYKAVFLENDYIKDDNSSTRPNMSPATYHLVNL